VFCLISLICFGGAMYFSYHQFGNVFLVGEWKEIPWTIIYFILGAWNAFWIALFLGKKETFSATLFKILLAIGIFSSSLTSSQIVAFILSMFLCWVFYNGLTLLGSFNLMGDFDFIIKYFGMSYHYDSIQRGVIDSSDIIYFLSLIFLFIASSLTIIKSLKK
jgi:hypothetical protein